MSNIRKKTIIVIALITMLVSMLFTFFVGISYAAATRNKFDDTNILDDLQSASVNGQPFDINKYRPDNKKTLELITLIEYCYTTKVNLQGNYGLYVYVYNPKQLNIDSYNPANKIQIAVKFDAEGKPSDYHKFKLKYCNKSTDTNYENTLYKFKVVDEVGADNKTILQRVNANERRYDISGIELVTKGQANATDYSVGGTYKYSGFAKGYGADINADSTLSCSVNELETVQLDVRDTTYRTGVSSAGKGYQNQVTSAYFAVDNNLMDKYGKLQKIKAEYYDYQTAPIIITNNYDFKTDYINNYIGVQSNYYNSANPYKGYDEEKMHGVTMPTLEYPLSFNIQNGIGTEFGKRIKQLPMWFYTPADLQKYVLPSRQLKSYMYNYTASYHAGTIDKVATNGKKMSADLFTNAKDSSGKLKPITIREFDTDDTFDLLSYDSSHSGWQKFCDYLWGKIDTSEAHYGKSPIVPITLADLQGDTASIAKNWLIDESDIQDIKNYINANGDKTVHLFRFGISDYFAIPFTIRKGGVAHSSISTYAQETVYLDFDIITLTFNKDGNYTVIPVVSNPIDIVPNITPPLVPEDGKDWLKLILMILAVIILLVILMPFLPTIISIVIAVVKLPFKLVGAVFKGVKKSGSKGGKSPPEYSSNNAKVKYDGDDKQLARERFKKE